MLFYDNCTIQFYALLILYIFISNRGVLLLIYNNDINELMIYVKHIMLDKNITQKNICEKTGWSKATVSNLLAGRTKSPGINVIKDLCNAIDCDLQINIVSKKEL